MSDGRQHHGAQWMPRPPTSIRTPGPGGGRDAPRQCVPSWSRGPRAQRLIAHVDDSPAGRVSRLERGCRPSQARRVAYGQAPSTSDAGGTTPADPSGSGPALRPGRSPRSSNDTGVRQPLVLEHTAPHQPQPPGNPPHRTAERAASGAWPQRSAPRIQFQHNYLHTLLCVLGYPRFYLE